VQPKFVIGQVVTHNKLIIAKKAIFSSQLLKTIVINHVLNLYDILVGTIVANAWFSRDFTFTCMPGIQLSNIMVIAVFRVGRADSF